MKSIISLLLITLTVFFFPTITFSQSISINGVSPGSGTASAPVSPTIYYSVGQYSEVYITLDGGYADDFMVDEGDHQWTSPSLSAGGHNYSITIWDNNGNQSQTSVDYTVNQSVPSYSISVSASPSGTASGGGTYNQGNVATVTATPAPGYGFKNWTENGTVISTSPSYSFTVTRDRSLVANNAVTTTYEIPIILAINSSGINRFIADQWNDVNFAKRWSGNDYNLNVAYDFQLNGPPIIILVTNMMKIKMTIKINYLFDHSNNTMIYSDRTFTITASLTIPASTFTTDIISTQYTDLHSVVVSAIDNAKMQALAEQKLAQITWNIYKGKILSIPLPPLNKVSDSPNISWDTNPSYIVSIYGGELQIKVTPILTLY